MDISCGLHRELMKERKLVGTVSDWIGVGPQASTTVEERRLEDSRVSCTHPLTSSLACTSELSGMRVRMLESELG